MTHTFTHMSPSVRIRRTQSGSLPADSVDSADFRRGGFRATTGPRLACVGTADSARYDWPIKIRSEIQSLHSTECDFYNTTLNALLMCVLHIRMSHNIFYVLVFNCFTSY